MFFPVVITIWAGIAWFLFSVAPWWVALIGCVIALPLSILFVLMIMVIMETKKNGFGGPRIDKFS